MEKLLNTKKLWIVHKALSDRNNVDQFRNVSNSNQFIVLCNRLALFDTTNIINFCYLTLAKL